MDAQELLVDHFGRIHEVFGTVTDGLDPVTANRRPEETANSITWLLWHLTRVQDDHVAGLSGEDQVWEGWRERFALPLEDHDTGYGHGDADVAAVQVDDVDLLTGYHEDVHAATLAYLGSVDDDGLDRVVDEAWDPPVTAGVRLVSVIGDCLQHLGQAAYAKGLS